MKLLSYAIVFLLLPTCLFGQVQLDFNNYTSSTNNDLVNNFTVLRNYVQTDTHGITGGSISLVHATESAEAVLNQPVQWQSNGTIRASIFFQYKNNPDDTLSLDGISVNFLIPDSSAPLAYDTTSQTSFSISTRVFPTSRIVRMRSSLNSVVILTTNLSSFNNPDSFKVNHWYELSCSLDRNLGGDSASIEYEVTSYGLSGLQKGAILGNLNTAYSNCTKLRNTPHLQFRLKSHPLSCVSRLDNLSINGFPTNIKYLNRNTKSINVYPNPTDNILNITDSKNEATECEIFSIEGKLILQTNLNTNNFIDLQYLKTGNYFLIIKNRSGENLYRNIIMKR